MFRNLMSILAIVFLAIATVGCAGTPPPIVSSVPGGYLIQYSKTDAVGINNSGVAFVPKSNGQPTTYEEIHTVVEDSYDQGCPNPNQRKNIKHREHTETITKEVPPAEQQAIVPLGYGSGYGPVELVGSALMNALGQVGAGMATGGTSIAVGGAKIIGSGNSKSNSEINNSGNSKSISKGGAGGNATGGTAYGGDASAKIGDISTNSGAFSSSDAKSIADQTTIQKTNIGMSQITGVEFGR